MVINVPVIADVDVIMAGGSVAAIRAAGFSFAVWTVDTPELAKKYLDLKVDAITSNRAAWLQDMFR